MPVTVIPQEGGLFDPDDMKIPESPDHRRMIDAIGLAAATHLDPDHQVFRDMNWYPSDRGPAMAPDIMVLPAGAFVAPPASDPDERLKSYRQDKTAGPSPTVVVEVPSESESFLHLRAKADRCSDLGAVVYIVMVDAPHLVERFSPERRHPEIWADQPIPELGGIRITPIDGVSTIITPDGLRAASDRELLAGVADRADEAERRAQDLARRLRELGHDPEQP